METKWLNVISWRVQSVFLGVILSWFFIRQAREELDQKSIFAIIVLWLKQSVIFPVKLYDYVNVIGKRIPQLPFLFWRGNLLIGSCLWTIGYTLLPNFFQKDLRCLKFHPAPSTKNENLLTDYKKVLSRYLTKKVINNCLVIWVNLSLGELATKTFYPTQHNPLSHKIGF